MKHLVTLVVAGIIGVMLVACGKPAPKQPEVQTQEQAAPAPAPEAVPVAPEAPKQ